MHVFRCECMQSLFSFKVKNSNDNAIIVSLIFHREHWNNNVCYFPFLHAPFPLNKKELEKKLCHLWVIRYAPTFVYTKYVSQRTQFYIARPNKANLILLGGWEYRGPRVWAKGIGPRVKKKCTKSKTEITHWTDNKHVPNFVCTLYLSQTTLPHVARTNTSILIFLQGREYRDLWRCTFSKKQNIPYAVVVICMIFFLYRYHQ